MVTVQNLKKYYKSNVAINKVSFNIEKGDVFGIVGHSGAGKSTLLRCLNGLEDYEEGSIKVFGKEIKDLKKDELREFRKNIGMIFQHFNLMKRLTVSENIEMPLNAWKYKDEDKKERVAELLELVGLSHKANAYPSNLSGGEKQRVGIARALALNPEILLCDEATSALDPKTTKSILDLLLDINERLNITIIVVTHQMEVVKTICKKMMLLEKGEIKVNDFTEEVFLNPTKELEELLGESEIIPNEGTNIKILFPKNSSTSSLITSMAREINIDFSICWGKLERFREDVLGSLIINVKKEDEEKVFKYLKNANVFYEIRESIERGEAGDE